MLVKMMRPEVDVTNCGVVAKGMHLLDVNDPWQHELAAVGGKGARDRTYLRFQR